MLFYFGAKHRGRDLNTIKRFERSTRQAEVHRTECLSAALIDRQFTRDLEGLHSDQSCQRSRSAYRQSVVSGSVMSVSLHSAELGFTLIKEGLPKSAGSSLAPLQPRAEREFALLAILRSPFSYPLRHAAHVHPIQKKKTLICLSSCLSLSHFPPLSL